MRRRIAHNAAPTYRRVLLWLRAYSKTNDDDDEDDDDIALLVSCE